MNWFAVIPPLITIVLTFWTKKLIPSLLAGVVAGAVMTQESAIAGVGAIGGYIVDAVAEKDSAYTLSFLIAFGSLAELIEMAGGIAGFSKRVEKWATTEKGVLGWGWLLSVITFFDSSFHTIAVGTVLSPLVEKVKGSREKFAFILSVTSLQLILLIPIATSYLGYMVTLVTNNTKDLDLGRSAYTVVAQSVIWNFFSIAMLLLAGGVTLFGLWFGKVVLGKAPAEEEELTEAHLEKEEAANTPVEEHPRRARNLVIPVLALLASTIFFFWWTGREKASGFVGALTNADFNVAIFAGILVAISVAIVYFLFQKISLAEIESHIIIGAEKVLSLVMILVLSWALTGVTRDLGFDALISQGVIGMVPAAFIPALTFAFAGAISYTIGSSWATWALVMPMAVTFAANTGIDVAIMVGTVWAGGAVTDVVSPLSAQMAGISFGRHLTTGLPYVIAGAVLAAAGYILVGLFFL
ncbi:Na+/H+ antiporter NhaC family protein [Anaeroselena agilis]|uniref:Na+/H+ antiporter NhaC family protein n=1 Tax=Anaeroselena agilis TaxID=3063788 RepID=A0ABU3NU28_9FIRM|nr:Na+/H+ antiporter NhaC family protein [Selenomonadales bacterium 4137-cl]